MTTLHSTVISKLKAHFKEHGNVQMFSRQEVLCMMHDIMLEVME